VNATRNNVIQKLVSINVICSLGLNSFNCRSISRWPPQSWQQHVDSFVCVPNLSLHICTISVIRLHGFQRIHDMNNESFIRLEMINSRHYFCALMIAFF